MKKRIAVIGDACLDRFTYCSPRSLAPDLPVPVVDMVRSKQNDGMAANVAENFRRLGNHVSLFAQDNWETVIKERFVSEDTNHYFLRVDYGNVSTNRLDFDEIGDSLLDFDAIAIADYDKGFLSRDAINKLFSLPIPLFIDTKKTLGDWLAGASIVKVNRSEAEGASDLSREVEDNLVVTLGSQGARYRGVTFPTKPVLTQDLSGAGDAFFAALVSAILDGRDVQRAVVYANKAARTAVLKPGVATIDVDKLAFSEEALRND